MKALSSALHSLKGGRTIHQCTASQPPLHCTRLDVMHFNCKPMNCTLKCDWFDCTPKSSMCSTVAIGVIFILACNVYHTFESILYNTTPLWMIQYFYLTTLYLVAPSCIALYWLHWTVLHFTLLFLLHWTVCSLYCNVFTSCDSLHCMYFMCVWWDGWLYSTVSLYIHCMYFYIVWWGGWSSRLEVASEIKAAFFSLKSHSPRDHPHFH